MVLVLLKTCDESVDSLDFVEPELKTEPQRFGSGPGGSNRPPRRTALGYMGEDDDASHNMRKWQHMQVKIVERGLLGYKIWLLATGDYAFLKTDLELQIGSTHDALFSQWNNDGSATFIPDWNAKANQQVRQQTFTLKDLVTFQMDAPSSKSRADLGSGSIIEIDNPTDMLPPALSISEYAPLDLISHKLKDYLDWFSQNSYTGIVKFKYPRFNSFGALVLFRGRCTGAMFTQEGQPDTLSTEESLPQLYKAMALLGADVISYTLPEEIILPISAAYIGYPVQPVLEDPHRNFDYLLEWFSKQSSIALVVINSKMSGTIFAYFFKGELVGWFCVELQRFSLNRQEVIEFVRDNADIELYVSILPNEVVAKSFLFGFELKL